MSRLSKQPIEIPKGVTVVFDAPTLTVTGPKGTLSRTVVPEIGFAVEEGAVQVSIVKQTQGAPAFVGTFASHLRNMMVGVTEGYKKQLEIEGVQHS